MLDDTRRRVFFCSCDEERHPNLACDPEFIWYEPQDIIKGRKLAVSLGYEDSFFAPYKPCSACRISRCTLWWERFRD